MGATNIHYEASKKSYESAREAYQSLREEAQYEYGSDPYSGTIATCTLEGKVSEPKDDDAYDEALDNESSPSPSPSAAPCSGRCA